MKDLINELTIALNIHIPDREQKIWFFRTNSGEYYKDYCINGFVALGWDKIDRDLITNSNYSFDQKKEKISELYPDELRPGLILGQMNTFYNKMNIGDIIIIPSQGGKQICIGILQDLINDIKHSLSEEEYAYCAYTHKRKVNWIKKIDSWQDIYLFKELRAQQTISDITDCAHLVYRNLYSAYVSKQSIHLTLQKKTNSDYSLKNNLEFSSAIISISENIAEMYNEKNITDLIKIKTAVGSPGFIEIIMPYVPITTIAIGIIINAVLGKTKTENKTTSSGVIGILDIVNKIINDHHLRKKTDAEINLLNAQACKTKAESKKISVETKLLEKNLNLPSQSKISNNIDIVEANCDKLKTATTSAGLIFSEVSENEKVG